MGFRVVVPGAIDGRFGARGLRRGEEEFRQVFRPHGETGTLDAAFQGYQSDHKPFAAEHRAAAASRVDRRRRLDVGLAANVALGVADDAVGHGQVQYGPSHSGVADDGDPFATLNVSADCQPHRPQRGHGIDFQQGKVNLRIGTEDPRGRGLAFELLPGLEAVGDRHVVGAAHAMVAK